MSSTRVHGKKWKKSSVEEVASSRREAARRVRRAQRVKALPLTAL
jgi:hypothetical protein